MFIISSQFLSSGSLETLQTIPEKNGTNIRDLLLKFHEQYYSANIMSVAVLGKGMVVFFKDP